MGRSLGIMISAFPANFPQKVQMAIVIVDGVEIDTTIWIDEHVARFND
jgi:hypothetical protein